MSRKQVIYFYEGETEKKLLKFLKNTKQIKPGKVKKLNLWKGSFKKIERTIDKKNELFFVVDTDDIENTRIFIDNIKSLNSYNFCLIVQDKNLEDEFCFACEKSSNKKLFNDFYKAQNSDKFKSKFCKDNNIFSTLSKNNFVFSKLWIRGDRFTDFLKSNNIKIDINYKYRVKI
jgi:hypothetical protein